jgi:hypothetical protein
VEITEDTNVRAEVERAAADMAAAVGRLAELSRAHSEMSSMVAVLDALGVDGGPLAALGDLLSAGAEWLVEFEDDDAETAADRLDDTAGVVENVRYGLDIALRIIRPLAGESGPEQTTEGDQDMAKDQGPDVPATVTVYNEAGRPVVEIKVGDAGSARAVAAKYEGRDGQRVEITPTA